MVTPDERAWMWQTYAPEPRMRLNLGIRRRLAPLLDNEPQKILLLNSLLFTLGGSPFLYYGDEIGMGDNIWLDDRNGLRTPMQWHAGPNGGFSTAPAEKLYAPVNSTPPYDPAAVNVAEQERDGQSLLNKIRHMIAIRKQHPVFGAGSFRWAQVDSAAVAAYWREDAGERILVLNNLAGAAIQVAVPPEHGGYGNILDGTRLDGPRITLAPPQYLWLTPQG